MFVPPAVSFKSPKIYAAPRTFKLFTPGATEMFRRRNDAASRGALLRTQFDPARAAHAMLRIVLKLPPVFWLMRLWLAFLAGLVWVACPRMFQLE